MLQVALLREQNAFRILWGARTISILGAYSANVAFVVLVYRLEGSGAAVGLLVLFQTLPRCLGFVAGAIVDRYDQRYLLLIGDIGQAFLVGMIALLQPSLWIFLTMVAGAAALSTVVWPAGRSAVPTLVARRQITQANALLALSLNVGVAVGPLIGGLCIAATDVQGALLVSGGAFVLGAVLAMRLPHMPPQRSAQTASVLRDTIEGCVYVARHRLARALGLGLLLLVSFGAFNNVTLVFMAQDELGTGEMGYTTLVSAFGVGMIVAPAALLRRSRDPSPQMMLLLGTGCMALGLLVTAGSPVFAVVFAAQTVAGIGNGLENVAVDSMVQREIPPEMLGRVFGALYSAISIAVGIAALLGGPLLDRTSPRLVYLVAGIGIGLVTAVWWRWLPRTA